MPKRLIIWLKRIVLLAIALVVLGGIVLHFLLGAWAAKPPPFPTDTAILHQPLQTNSGKVSIGKSWVEQREGLLVAHLRGSPFEIGYANGALLRPQIHVLETEFLNMVHSYVPNDWVLNILKDYVIYRNRHLSDFVPDDYRMEIYGATLGCPDVRPELGAYYNRVLNYHAAQDVSYMMIDNPLVSRAGCTAFAAWGDATPAGHLVTGRNFDWEAAEVFSTNRIVILCEPDKGIPFVSLAWAGMTGVVSGMNRAGLSVTINGAPSGLPDQTATPVAIVARDVLEHAHNISETLEIVRRSKVFVSTLWLVGSRADGRFIVIEKTPDTTQVREPAGNTIICANHFETPGLKDNLRNKEYETEATSISRKARLSELVKQQHGNIDPTNAAAILRDRRLPGGKFPGNGHRATLNALIATHGTVMDLTDGIFWAASPPNQLGKFVAFDVNDFNRELPDRAIPADPLVSNGEYEHALAARGSLAAGERQLKAGEATNALDSAGKAESLNPGFYQNASLRGRALLALKRNSEAAGAFRAALADEPAFLKEKRQIEALLREATSRN